MTKIKLKIKDLLFPGVDIILRKRIKVAKKYLMSGAIKTLDAGCGNGAFSLECYKLGNSVIGIDINTGNINRSLEYRDYKGIPSSKARFAVFNIYNLLELNQPFDQILCFEVLEHLLYDKRAIEIFAKLLNSGGILHLGVPNLNCPYHISGVISQIEDGGHVHRGYTYSILKEMCINYGLEIIREEAYGGFFTRQIYNISRQLQNIYSFIFKNSPRSLNIVKDVLIFLCLNPFTYLDNFLKIKIEPMSIYIIAKKI
jgi:SAM-dependent methyltransferase